MQENKNEKVNENELAPGMRPRLALYHANAKGTGCAIKMELHPAVGAAGRYPPRRSRARRAGYRGCDRLAALTR